MDDAKLTKSCTGEDDCERHPTLKCTHPSTPVTVDFSDGESATVDYSDHWEAAEADYARLAKTEMYQEMIKGIEGV